jgi:hypothetical protein
MNRISSASIRRIAQHLINFPKPETTKILTSVPSDDRIKILEELERIKKSDKQKNS